MKVVIFSLFAIILWFTSYSQADTSAVPTISNSCRSFLDHYKTSINYFYSDSTQVHDYSGNWDFDGDGKADALYFIGTGGAHLYFYLRVILSSDKKIRDFPFLELDLPCFGTVDALNKKEASAFFPSFVVDGFPGKITGATSHQKIYLHLDHTSEIPAYWKRRGVRSRELLVFYRKGEMVVEDFRD